MVSHGLTTTPPPLPAAERIPSEILGQIFGFLIDIDDLKNVRLVNKTCAELGAKDLYRDVFFIMLPKSGAKIKNIASHPKFSLYVQNITYFWERLDDNLCNFQNWCESSLNGRLPQGEDYSKYHTYLRLKYANDALLKNGQEAFLLEWVLKRFLNANCFRCARTGFERYRQTPKFRDNFAKTLQWLSEQTGLPGFSMLFVYNEESSDSAYPAFAVLRAINACGRNIVEMDLLYLPLRF